MATLDELTAGATGHFRSGAAARDGSAAPGEDTAGIGRGLLAGGGPVVGERRKSQPRNPHRSTPWNKGTEAVESLFPGVHRSFPAARTHSRLAGRAAKVVRHRRWVRGSSP